MKVCHPKVRVEVRTRLLAAASLPRIAKTCGDREIHVCFSRPITARQISSDQTTYIRTYLCSPPPSIDSSSLPTERGVRENRLKHCHKSIKPACTNPVSRLRPKKAPAHARPDGICRERSGPRPTADAKRQRSCTRATADAPCRHSCRGRRGLRGRRGRRVRRRGSCGGVHLIDLGALEPRRAGRARAHAS